VLIKDKRRFFFVSAWGGQIVVHILFSTCMYTNVSVHVR